MPDTSIACDRDKKDCAKHNRAGSFAAKELLDRLQEVSGARAPWGAAPKTIARRLGATGAGISDRGDTAGKARSQSTLGTASGPLQVMA